MKTRSATRREKDLVSLYQVDLDISGPLARSLHAEQERILAEERLAAENDASGGTGDQEPINPDGLTTSKKRLRDSDITDSPQWAKIAKTGEAIILRNYLRTVAAHSATVHKNKFLGYLPRAVKFTNFGNPKTEKLKFNAVDFASTKPGFVAKDYPASDAEKLGKVYTVEELLQKDFKLIAWDGRYAISSYQNAHLTCGGFRENRALLDAEKRIIAVLVARPPDKSWNDAVTGTESAFMNARRHMSASSSATSSRGKFTKVNAGYSFGGGQKVRHLKCHDPSLTPSI
jgi:hypothetical protein